MDAASVISVAFAWLDRYGARARFVLAPSSPTLNSLRSTPTERSQAP
ncbi:hypothetical protein [Streptomyces mirabilis]|nr:hypothetical protein [Streptomyces mirabilis]